MPPSTAANAPPVRPRYDPETYHERRSPSPIADAYLDYVALQHTALALQHQFLQGVEESRRIMLRLNQLDANLTLLLQMVETKNDRRVKQNGPPLPRGTVSPTDESR